ncbi:unnamed protein product [Cunninghamella blakesleeana]
MDEDFNMETPNHGQLTQEIQFLRRQIEELRQVPPVNIQRVEEPRIAMPDPFTGNRKYAQNFLDKLQIVFSAQSNRYNQDSQKVALAGSLLKGPAFAWFSFYLRQNNQEILSNFNNFRVEFLRAYGDPDSIARAERKLMTIKQNGKPTAEYASEVRQLSSEVQWNDASLKSAFYQGLDEAIKDILCLQGIPDTFDALIRLAINIGNRLFDRQLEKKNKYRGIHSANWNRNLQQRNGPTPMELDMTTSEQSSENPNHISDDSDHNPFNISQTSGIYNNFTKLTTQERERRIKYKLCLYCGEKGHMVNNCFKKQRNQQKKQQPSTIAHTTSELHLRQEHLTLPIKLTFGNTTINTTALIDTGAHSCFISNDLVQEYNIPCNSKPEPIPVHTIDGSKLSGNEICFETKPLILGIQDHHESAIFNVLKVATYPVVLGAPWYKSHDPVTINWNKKLLEFNVPNFQNHQYNTSEFYKPIVVSVTLESCLNKNDSCITTSELSNSNTQVENSESLSVSISSPETHPESQHESANPSSPVIHSENVFESVKSVKPGNQPASVVHSGKQFELVHHHISENHSVNLFEPGKSSISAFHSEDQCESVKSVKSVSHSETLSINQTSPTILPENLCDPVNLSEINSEKQFKSIKQPESVNSSEFVKPSASVNQIRPLENNHNLETIQEENEENIPEVLPPQSVSVSTTPSEKSEEQLVIIPDKYKTLSSVFSKEEANILPQHRKYDMEIRLQEGTSPTWGPIYNLSEPELKALREYLDENLEKGFIKPSKSPAGAPILFVKKKDGSLRLCVDYRSLNKITIKNRYPLPLITEMIDRLKDATVFSKIDLRGAYNLVRIKPGDEWKTAFRTRYGHFEYNVMPFGLSNAPAVFQHMINDIFKDMLDRFVIAYLDDILVYSPNQETHDQHVYQVLERLKEYKLYAKLEKCSFDQQEVEFLGHVISPTGIGMDYNKIKSIQEWKPPTSVKELQVFLGFANYYRKFIKNYSKITVPLTKLLSKEKPVWEWTSESQSSFDKLKQLFCSAPILRHANITKSFILETDASDFAIGAVLSQYCEDNLLHPVAYYSRKLKPAEINYEIYDKELLAIIDAFNNWRHLLIATATPIKVYSDHKNLVYFTTTKRLNRRQVRWSLFLADFNFEITYRSGSKQGKPDALSRQPEMRLKEGDSEYEIQQQTLLKPHQFIFATFSESPIITKIKKEYKEDPLANKLLKSIKEKSDPHIKLYNELIFKNNKIYVPTSVRIDVLQHRHDSKLAGHYGHYRTLKLVKRSYWWPDMKSFVIKYIKTCQTCSRSKASRTSKTGELQPLSIPSKPWESISMDFVTDLPVSNGFDSILVIVDRLTKMGHFIPCKKTINSEETASLYIQNILRLHGLPKDIVSDRGPQFNSDFWKSFNKSLGTTVSLSSAFHPESDGQTERLNQTMEQYLRCYANYKQDNWVGLLPLAEFSYNNSEHSSIKKSPFYANYGHHPSIDFHLPELPSSTIAENKIEEMDNTIQELQDNMKKAQETYSRYANQKRTPAPNYNIGDKVWLKTTNIKTQRPSKKLDYKKLGPFKVIEKINPVAYRIELPHTMKIHNVFHTSLLTPVTENELSQRYQPAPPPIIVNGQEEFIVEKILDHRKRYGRLYYLVKWKDYGPEANTWEPIENLQPDDQELIPLTNYLKSQELVTLA